MLSKIIPHILYFGILTPALIFDIDRIEVYYVAAVVVIQLFFIVKTYIVAARKLPDGAMLLKESPSPSVIKMVLAMLFMLAIVIGFIFIVKLVSNKYLIIYSLIIMVSFIIQYFIIQRKKITPLFIHGHYLFSNELFLKSYNLETLLGISYDNFDEEYRIEFSKSGSIKIKQDDYDQTGLYSFFAAMIAQKGSSVFLSENIKETVMAVGTGGVTEKPKETFTNSG